MDEDASQLSLDERISILMADLPAPVQEFLKSPERDSISLSLSQKYGLHADTAGVFERAYLYMLLGVYTPDEFVTELRDARLDERTIQGLAKDVNEQVFKKLRERERQGAPAPRPAPEPLVPPIRIEAQPPVPPPVAPPPRAVEAPVNLPGQDIRPQPAIEPRPAAPQTPIYSMEPHPMPHARTMAGDIRIAQGDAPAPEPQAHPVYSPPPPPSPSAVPVSPAPAATPVQRAPLTKEYGADPYREPIE